MLNTLEPDNPLTAMWQDLQKGLRRGRPIPGGEFVITIAWYFQDIEETIQILDKARTGRISLKEIEQEQKASGKELFEV
jgi:hypothetical protein